MLEDEEDEEEEEEEEDEEEEEGEEEDEFTERSGKRKAEDRSRVIGPKISKKQRKIANRGRLGPGPLLSIFGAAKAAPSGSVGRERKPPVFARPNKKGAGSSRHQNGGRKTDVNKVTCLKRIEEFPGEFSFVGGNIFCIGCKTNVASGSSNFKKHRATLKHQGNVTKRKNQDDETKNLRGTLDSYFKSNSTDDTGVLGMERVSEQVQTFRADTIESFIKAGIPVAKIDALRPFLEKYAAMPLTGSNHLMETYMPPLTVKEFNKLKEETKGEVFGCYHDGTTYNGEAFTVVLRWMDASMTIKTRCVTVSILKSSLDAAELSGELITAIAATMGLSLMDVLAWMNDAAAANMSAFSSVLLAASPASDQNTCMGHTLSHVGEAIDAPHVDKFLTHYNAATGKSPNSRSLFREVTEFACERAGETRWNSEFDVVDVSLYPAHRIERLLEWAVQLGERDWCPKSSAKMRALLQDPLRSTLLLVGRLVEYDAISKCFRKRFWF
jgi:hypothetical protein